MDATSPRPPSAARSTKAAPRRFHGGDIGGGGDDQLPDAGCELQTGADAAGAKSGGGTTPAGGGPGAEAALVEIHPEDLQLEEKVGAGLTAEVYRGRYAGDVVAIKQLFRHRKMDLKEKVSFVREVAVLARVENPNLVKMFGVAFKVQPFRIVTEFCEGGTVFDAVHNGFMLAWPQRHKMCIDTARGMDYLHSFSPQIIHRDLKSLNLLLDRVLNTTSDVPLVKVSDFGLSRMRDDDPTQVTGPGSRIEVKETFTTKEGVKINVRQKGTIEDVGSDNISVKFDAMKEVLHVLKADLEKIQKLGLWGKMTSQVGTPHWMAPEVHAGTDYDERCDVYSYAMVVYEIVCRRVPFEDEEAKHIGNITTKGGRPDLDAVLPDSPKDVADLMVHCWAPDPMARPMFDEIVTRLNVIDNGGLRRRPEVKAGRFSTTTSTQGQGPFNVVSL
mmetsp:Transcript_70209/g.184021  ORF Transcript_70209/g.184021 Transcript_70209/m.184021 type:complete len:443 (+) Transcript_70209:1-1329(+)